MKKIFEIYRPYMIHPIIYKSAARFALALSAALLWNRFINREGLLSLGKHAFFVAGAFLLAMAWFNYLRLDGMRIHHLAERDRRKEKKKKHQVRDIVDFADEKIVSFDELEYDEKVFCKFSANLAVGAAFLVMSLFSALL